MRRTLERRIRGWRALHGREREAIFRRCHEPGRLGLSDIDAAGLGVAVAGAPLAHRLHHFRLAFSGFEHVHVVLGGEGFVAPGRGASRHALWSLGGAPHEHREPQPLARRAEGPPELRPDPPRPCATSTRRSRLTGPRGSRGAVPPPAPGRDAQRSRPGARERRDRGPARPSEARHRRRAVARAARPRSRTSPPTAASQAGSSGAGTPGSAPARRDRARGVAPAAAAAGRGRRGGRRRRHLLGRLHGSREVFRFVPPNRLRARLHDDRLEVFPGATHLMTLPRGRSRGDGRHGHVVDHRHVIHAARGASRFAEGEPPARRRCRGCSGATSSSREAHRRLFEAATAALPAKRACRLTLDALALAHERGCEGELAGIIVETLDEGALPDIAELRRRFAPDPAALPEIAIPLAPLTDHDALMAASAVGDAA